MAERFAAAQTGLPAVGDRHEAGGDAGGEQLRSGLGQRRVDVDEHTRSRHEGPLEPVAVDVDQTGEDQRVVGIDLDGGLGPRTDRTDRIDHRPCTDDVGLRLRTVGQKNGPSSYRQWCGEGGHGGSIYAGRVSRCRDIRARPVPPSVHEQEGSIVRRPPSVRHWLSRRNRVPRARRWRRRRGGTGANPGAECRAGQREPPSAGADDRSRSVDSHPHPAIEPGGGRARP